MNADADDPDLDGELLIYRLRLTGHPDLAEALRRLGPAEFCARWLPYVAERIAEAVRGEEE